MLAAYVGNMEIIRHIEQLGADFIAKNLKVIKIYIIVIKFNASSGIRKLGGYDMLFERTVLVLIITLMFG